MQYKKIIKKRSTRYKILSKLTWVPDNIMIRIQYRLKMGFWPDFNHPQRFTEKLQLYKISYHNPDMPLCVDKYDVRDYVKKKGLDSILNECYGVYENLEDIDWDKLPNQFVMKKTTGGGGLNVVIVVDKKSHDLNKLKQRVHNWTVPRKKVSGGREWAYDGIQKNRVIFEKLIVDDINKERGLDDYKIFCFKGKPFCVQVDSDRQREHHQNYYDTNWNSLGVHCSYSEGELQDKPQNFSAMLKIAGKLSEDFPFVRVDLYNVNGNVIFGELTFYPTSGYGKFHPDSFDFELGEQFDVSLFKN